MNHRRRDGETVLRQCQLTQLYILHVIDQLCVEHGLTYLLEGGTLIGAMRHNGFIPWDDDLDIGMPRKDYNKFLKLAMKELPEGLKLQTPGDTPRSAIPFAKVRDCNSFYCECRPDVSTRDPSGIYVDIFPYDDLPNIGYPLEKLLVKATASSFKRSKFFYNRGGSNFFLVVGCAVLALFCQIVHGLMVLVRYPLNWIFGSKKVVACINEGYTFFYEKKSLYPAVKHTFEDGQFPVPHDADGILTAQYGDWRQIPPPDQRPRHARIIDPFHAAVEM